MYIDPNTGGQLFQILLVVFSSLSAIILFFGGRIRMFFARLRRGRRVEAEETPASDETTPQE